MKQTKRHVAFCHSLRFICLLTLCLMVFSAVGFSFAGAATATPLQSDNVTLSWTSKAYNSAVQKPTVTVKNASGTQLTLDKSYTVTYSAESKDPGSYSVTVKGKGNYTGTVTKSYKITTQPLKAANVTLSWTSKAYSSSVQKPTVTVKNASGATLTEGTSYTVSYSADSKDPGSYTVSVTGKGKFSGTVTKSYKITAQPLNAANVTLSWTSKAYNSKVQKPAVTAKNAAGATLTKGTSYTVAYSADSKAPGSYTVSVTGKGKFSGTVTKSYKITKQPLTSSNVILAWTSKAYNSSVQKPAVTVKNAAGTTLTEGTSYTVSYSADSKAPGSYTVSVTGKGNFSGTVTKTYKITKQALSGANVSLSWTTKAYSSSVQKPTVTVKNAAGTKLTEGTSYTVSYSAESKDPGSYTLSVTGKGNFSGTVSKSYKITQQPIKAENITLSWETKEYNGSVQKPTVTVKNTAGSRLTEGTSYTVSYSTDSKVPGSYTLSVTGKGKFSGTVSKAYKITKQTLSASRVTLSWTSKPYSGNAQKPAITVKNAQGTVLTQDTSYTVSWSGSCISAGTYTATVTGTGRYQGTVRKQFTITDIDPTVTTMTQPTFEHSTSGSLNQYTFTFRTIPHNLEELQQIDISDAETGGYLTTCLSILLYDVYVPQDGELYGDKTSNATLNSVYDMLKYLCEYNPDSTASTTYHNKLYENDTKTTVHDQLYYNNKYKYTLKSYLNGATVENGYTPTLPISITVTEDPGGTVEATTGYPKKLRFSFQSAGADAARYVDMFYSTKNKRWYVWGETWKYMLQSVRDPVVQWLAEYPSVPAGRTMQQPTYVRTEKVLKDFEFIDNITDEPRKEDVTLAQYTFTFPTLPKTLGELMQFDLSDPETGGYLTTCLYLLIYDNYVPQDGELYGDKTSNESLNEVYAMLQYLCDYNPDSSSSTNYHNKLFESATKTFVHDQLSYNDQYKYILNSYKNGASIYNEYTPDQPVSITVNEYPYSVGEATAGRPKQIRFTFTSAGADGDRFLEAFYDGPNNRWFIYGTTWKFPLTKVKDPVPDEF